jgi:hypothetical protein
MDEIIADVEAEALDPKHNTCERGKNKFIFNEMMMKSALF